MKKNTKKKSKLSSKEKHTRYPQIQITTDAETKKKIINKIKKIQKERNDNRLEDDWWLSMSDIAIEALKKGLKIL